MNYIFRMPKFPVLVDVGDQLIWAKSRVQLERKLSRLSFEGEEGRRVIDATAEGFTFYPKMPAIAPSMAIRRWKKQQIIDLYNARRVPGAPELSSASLGSRTLQRILLDTVELLARH